MKTTVPSGALVNLRLDQLDDAPDNPRIRFDEASLAQLIDSMSSVGLLHPIVVRALKVPASEPSRFEIVCGHRRRAAAARLQWETIPATVHSLTPAQASDMALVENLQREDLTELEEAEGYSQMLARGQTPDEIAARLGRSESSVLNRLVLVNLPEAATAAMREGRLTASVATLIGRLAGAQQREDATDAVLSEERQEWDPETETTVAIPMSFRSARSMIRRQFMLGLESPPFDADDACLVPASGACGPCRHRTGNQVTLFGDMVAQRGGGEVCTYPPCFDQKRQATVDQVLATAAEAGLATVPAKKAAKIFTSDGYLHHGSGFVETDEKRPGSKKTWREILGRKAPEELVACSPRGRAVSLYRQKDVNAILEAKAEKSAAKKGAINGGADAERQKFRPGIVAREKLTAAIVAQATAQWPALRRIIALELLNEPDVSNYAEDRRAIPTAFDERQLYVDTLPDTEVDGLIAEIALSSLLVSAFDGYLGDKSGALLTAVERAVGLTRLEAMQAARNEADQGVGHE